MPTVTGTLADIGLGPLAGLSPVLQFAPSEPAADTKGRVFASKPVEVEPSSSGAFSVSLASTEGLIPKRAHWVLSIGWRNPDGFMSSAGYFAKDFPTWKIRVPSGGGRLSDMLGGPVPNDVAAVALLTEQTAEELYERGIRWVFDLSATPATLNRLEA